MTSQRTQTTMRSCSGYPDNLDNGICYNDKSNHKKHNATAIRDGTYTTTTTTTKTTNGCHKDYGD